MYTYARTKYTLASYERSAHEPGHNSCKTQFLNIGHEYQSLREASIHLRNCIERTETPHYILVYNKIFYHPNRYRWIQPHTTFDYIKANPCFWSCFNTYIIQVNPRCYKSGGHYILFKKEKTTASVEPIVVRIVLRTHSRRIKFCVQKGLGKFLNKRFWSLTHISGLVLLVDIFPMR